MGNTPSPTPTPAPAPKPTLKPKSGDSWIQKIINKLRKDPPPQPPQAR